MSGHLFFNFSEDISAEITQYFFITLGGLMIDGGHQDLSLERFGVDNLPLAILHDIILRNSYVSLYGLIHIYNKL